ncbi:uncharacterized protein BDV17DRAFT_270976 [Aspergillus undulatus]|uniref:uncharacterized protein n=1 Tax=Aspergillus undulatus TaxID=1810928 RepID=UPI003CCCAE22
MWILNFSSINPTMAEWTDEEVAVLVYFASIGVYHHVISLLLRRRGFFRSNVAVRNKLARIQDAHTDINNRSATWSMQIVDTILDTLNFEPITLLRPTSEDQCIINRFQTNINLWSCHLVMRNDDAHFLIRHGLW